MEGPINSSEKSDENNQNVYSNSESKEQSDRFLPKPLKFLLNHETQNIRSSYKNAWNMDDGENNGKLNP